jgi:hypothetical protein
MVLKGIIVTFFVFFAERIGVTRDARGDEVIANDIKGMGGNELELVKRLLQADQGFLDTQEQAEQVQDGPVPRQDFTETDRCLRSLKQPCNLQPQSRDGLA